MALFAIADLHLSGASDHKMDVFGPRWQDYTQKIKKNWTAVVSPEDTVVIPGDISWALTLEETKCDFAFLDSLPGKKLLGKGNHDFWWCTAAKATRFFTENHFSSLSLLYNNAYVVEDFIVCGTRGWFLEENQQLTVGSVDYKKIMNRELMRLKLSLQAAKLLQTGENVGKEILVFLHFPPVFRSFRSEETLQILHQAGVRRCFFGHIHGVYTEKRENITDGIRFTMISSDFLSFVPYRIFPEEK